jgi:hypothetical protein
MYNNIDKELIKKDILQKFGWEVDKLIKINMAFSDYNNLKNMLKIYERDYRIKRPVVSKQMIVSFNISDDYYDKNKCPLCDNVDSKLDYYDYNGFPTYLCENCYTTVYEKITDFEEQLVKQCCNTNPETDNNDDSEADADTDKVVFKTLYIHYAIDSGSFDNAVNYYYKHNTLPFLTDIERELWRVADIIQIDETEQIARDNILRGILDNDNMKNPFMELLFKNIGLTINNWYLSKEIDHYGVYAYIQVSDNPNTPYEERYVCILSGD